MIDSPSFAHHDQMKTCHIYNSFDHALDTSNGFKLVINGEGREQVLEAEGPDGYDLDSGACFKHHCQAQANFYSASLVCGREGATLAKFSSLEQMVGQKFSVIKTKWQSLNCIVLYCIIW